MPNWTDLSPRLGAAYDLFGNGKTAIKGSIGRYVLSAGSGLAYVANPANAIVGVCDPHLGRREPATTCPTATCTTRPRTASVGR